jgi:uncharacterized membrane protein
MIEQDAFNGLVILTKFLEVAGAGAIVLGFIIASVRCLREAFGKESFDWYNDYRKALGRVVLIGLEVLVAATILKTITTDSSLESLGMLAIMIVIRTILSWSMVLEITGRWPWQSAPIEDS